MRPRDVVRTCTGGRGYIATKMIARALYSCTHAGMQDEWELQKNTGYSSHLCFWREELACKLLVGLDLFLRGEVGLRTDQDVRDVDLIHIGLICGEVRRADVPDVDLQGVDWHRGCVNQIVA